MSPFLRVEPLVGGVLNLSSRGTVHTLEDWQWALGVLFGFVLAGLASAFSCAKPAAAPSTSRAPLSARVGVTCRLNIRAG